jgi:hypothetical protein
VKRFHFYSNGNISYEPEHFKTPPRDIRKLDHGAASRERDENGYISQMLPDEDSSLDTDGGVLLTTSEIIDFAQGADSWNRP